MDAIPALGVLLWVTQAMQQVLQGNEQGHQAWYEICRRHDEDVTGAAARHAEAGALQREHEADAGPGPPTSMPAPEPGRPATPCYLEQCVSGRAVVVIPIQFHKANVLGKWLLLETAQGGMSANH